MNPTSAPIPTMWRPSARRRLGLRGQGRSTALQYFRVPGRGLEIDRQSTLGVTSLSEYLAVLAEQRMGRFGLSPAWRNMAVFGALDEIRHTQMDLYLAHEFIAKDPQFDWALKAYHTNEWGIIAARALFDGMMLAPNAVDIAIQLPFTLETGFTNPSSSSPRSQRARLRATSASLT